MNKRIITVIIVLAVIVIFAVITVVGSLRNQPPKLGVQVLNVNLAGKIPTIDTLVGRVAKFW
ncbi:MAG: hypothetical protein WA364_11355 [Candidatus Nitrosopolaris sp.]